ncbi:MAG: sulfite exporter TauE/SafE family protein [Weeksellaceae bacterium]|nr:sulfite exporter TauE/SafE family protein [Weeksellaceae bacterium]
MEDLQFLFFVAMLVVSFLYASVGHGGASGYLALMAIFLFPPQEMKINALVMNIAVSGLSFLSFYQQERFQRRIFIKLALLSIPMAMLGGYMQLSSDWFKIALGIVLVLPILKFLGLIPGWKIVERTPGDWMLYAAGASIGLFSGLLGIGGGIILTPLVILLGWSDVKQAAMLSALFIFVNSASGLIGASFGNLEFSDSLIWMVPAVVLGGFAGATMGSQISYTDILKKIIAVVLVFAVYKLWFT